MARLLAEVFADPSVLRLVVEPDIDNAKSVALLGRAGFEWDSVIDLPHKKARLGFMTAPHSTPWSAVTWRPRASASGDLASTCSASGDLAST